MNGNICEGGMSAHMDSTGSDLSGFAPLVLKGGEQMKPEYCQSLCCKQSKCDVFTYDTGQGPSGTANCWLKTNGHLTTGGCGVGSHVNCTSGVVRNSHGGGGGGGGGGSAASDPLNKIVAWSSIGIDVVNSTAHQAVNYQAALESIVLLKNAGTAASADDTGAMSAPVLPLTKGTHIAVVGPSAVTQFGLLSDYYGDMVCYGAHETSKDKTFDCIPTIASQISAANSGGTTTVAGGVEMRGSNASGIPAAVAAVAAADVVVMVLGIDHDIEHEGVDVSNTSLPGLQESFAQQILAKGKPTVLIIVGDDCSGIDSLIGEPGKPLQH